MRRVVLVLLVALVALGGCTSTPTPPPTPQPFTVPTTTASRLPSVELTAEEIELYGPRVELPGGLLLKQFGKVAQYGGPGDDIRSWGIRVVVDEVLVDPSSCGEYVSDPERGHRLVLGVRVETSSEYQPMTDAGPQYYNWTITGPDGVTESASSTGAQCNRADELPFEFRPSAQYRGQVVLDSRYASGQIVLINAYAWDFPGSA